MANNFKKYKDLNDSGKITAVAPLKGAGVSAGIPLAYASSIALDDGTPLDSAIKSVTAKSYISADTISAIPSDKAKNTAYIYLIGTDSKQMYIYDADSADYVSIGSTSLSLDEYVKKTDYDTDNEAIWDEMDKDLQSINSHTEAINTINDKLANLSVNFTTDLADTAKSDAHGGLPSTTVAELKKMSVSKILELILFPAVRSAITASSARYQLSTGAQIFAANERGDTTVEITTVDYGDALPTRQDFPKVTPTYATNADGTKTELITDSPKYTKEYPGYTPVGGTAKNSTYTYQGIVHFKAGSVTLVDSRNNTFYNGTAAQNLTYTITVKVNFPVYVFVSETDPTADTLTTLHNLHKTGKEHELSSFTTDVADGEKYPNEAYSSDAAYVYIVVPFAASAPTVKSTDTAIKIPVDVEVADTGSTIEKDGLSYKIFKSTTAKGYNKNYFDVSFTPTTTINYSLNS